MRSFFKKPAWAINSGNTGTEFYRRSEQTYADIVAAEREAHKKPKPSPESEDTTIQSHRPSKRPRLSDEVRSEDAGADVDGASQSAEGNEPAKQQRLSNSPPKRAASAEEPQSPEALSPGSLDVSRLDSSQPSLEDSMPLESLARDPSPQEPKTGSRDMEEKRHSCPNPPTAPLPAAHSSTSMSDPTVQILITSLIPSTKPLLVHRKMSQSLREVRVEWCKRQGFTSELQSSVYLTWKGRRLFDVTTCRSLGIRVESKFALSDEDYDSDTGPRELRIHMEAVTENPVLLNRPGSSPSGRSQEPPTPLSPGQDQDEPMKLILRSPGLDDFRIKARPRTLVSKLISAFRDKHGIPNQDISLLFDGDRLDPGACLRDYDIADLDLVDVQIRQRS